MPWTNPKTWTTGELLSAADLNTQLRDNLNALKAPPSAQFLANESTNYTTTSTTFVNVDNTAGKFNLTITTTGGDVMIGFTGNFNTGGFNLYLDVELDGARIAGDDGLLVVSGAVAVQHGSFVHLKTGVTAASHTFKLQWKMGGGTGTLYAGAGTALYDVHPQFWVREVS